MNKLKFVPQTGTKDEKQEMRVAIRRHVMLGKNQGRRPNNPRQPNVEGATVFHINKDDGLRNPEPAFRSVVPRRVGTDLSFSTFAENVEHSLMGETLQFCSASTEYMYVLEPCVFFESDNASAACLNALTCDALHVNVMVWGAQAYMDLAFWQSTLQVRRSNGKASSQHYGKALGLLRERLADAEDPAYNVSEMTIMAIASLAMHAIASGESEKARIHLLGLSKLIGMNANGVYSFRNMATKQRIDLLRCDISLSLATGQAPLFSTPADSSTSTLPDLTAQESNHDHYAPIIHSRLARTWTLLRGFCTTINNAAADGSKLSLDVFLESMSSIMYELLHTSITTGLIDEMFRLAMLSFCTSTFLHWRRVPMPHAWLQLQYKRLITGLMQSNSTVLDSDLLLWLLIIYGVTFPPLSSVEQEILQSWLLETTHSCGLNNWEGVINAVEPKFLWIDIVCNRPARKILDETFKQRSLAI